MPHFEIAIVDSNILAALGLQPLLTDLIPVAEVHIFISFDELQAADQGQFVHYFVASRLYFEHAAYFREKTRRAIVLVNGDLQIAGVPTLNVCQSEQALVKSILAIRRQGHPHLQASETYHPVKWKWRYCLPKVTSTRKLLASFTSASPQPSPTARTSWRNSMPAPLPISSCM